MNIKATINKPIKWILAIGLSGALVEPVKSLFNWIPWQSIISRNTWNWLWTPRFSILSLLIWAICTFFILWLIKKLATKIKESQKNSNSLETYLKQINNLVDEKAGIKVTWDVGIRTMYNNDPFPYNIRVFCLKHGEIPLQMSHGHCMDFNCENSHLFLTGDQLKNQIESILLHEREKAIEAGFK